MSKNLQASVKLKTTDAVRQLDRLEKKINSVHKKLNRVSNMNTGIARSINQKTNAEKQHAHAVRQTNNEYKKSNSLVTALSKKISLLAGAYLGIMGAKTAINLSDTITSAENKLDYVNNYDTALTQEAMDKMYVSSQKVRMNYADMMANVSKSMTLAGKAFDNNIDNAIRFQEIMSEAYTIGGASAQEMSSSMYQMIQALGAGILAGDELRSVREGAPIAYKRIEEFAQGVYNTNESLKDLASQGKITSDLVVAAMLNAGEGIDDAFAHTKMTFAQAFTMMKNTAIKSFEPVLRMLNEALRSDAGTAVINGIAYALQFVAGVITLVFRLIQTVYTFIVDHWETIRKILMLIGIAMAIYLFPKFIALIKYIAFAIYYYTYLGAVAVASAIKAMIAWMAANWVMALIIIVIAAIVIALVWLADSFADACGMIVGVVFVALAFIYNQFVGVINAILQVVWSTIDPILGVIEFILNACNGGFNSFGDAVANLIGNIIGWFLSLGKVVTKIIDAIFGTNWTAGLESLRSNVLAWGKNEDAITLDRNAPELQRIEYSNAYNAGYDLGYAGGEWISNQVSGVGNWINDNLGIGNLPSGTNPAYDLNTTNPSSGLPSGADDANRTLNDISDDTSKIADAVALSAEDLEYLRKVAAMEWKKEFTTANITVDMKNYNTVNGDTDLDGIVTTLTKKLYEELDAVADGVYA